MHSCSRAPLRGKHTSRPSRSLQRVDRGDRPGCALAELREAGKDGGTLSLVSPFGARIKFVNRHDPTPGTFRSRVDFTPRTYRDVIEGYERHPERKFADRDGKPCQPSTAGVLFDLPINAQWIRLIGKEANEIEQIDAGLFENEDERMIVYDEGEWEAIRREIVKIPTKELQRMTGYSRSMVKYLKSGKRTPNAERRSYFRSLLAALRG